MSARNYTVYFEIYGKKMKAKVLAKSVTEAKEAIKNELKFHKIVAEQKDEFNQSMNLMDKITDIFK